MVKVIKKIGNGIASGFLVLLVLLCVYVFIVTDVMKRDYVNVFGYTYFVVATGSMSGTIEVNDIILVKLADNVKVGDIITYRNSDGNIITHRLIEKSGSKYITQGDANNVSDEPISKEQIIGIVGTVVSPSVLLKSIILLLILFIFFILISFDNLLKKYIVNDDAYNKKLSYDLFVNPKKQEEEQSTVTISIDEMENLEKAHEKECAKEEDIEVLDLDEYLDEEPLDRKKSRQIKEKETIDLVVSILKCKKNHVTKVKMNKKWLTRYQYIYKISHLILNSMTEQFVFEVENPPFKEIYNYDLERVGLTETIRNRIYEMPVYGFLRILAYTILYNDDEMFDGVYKIFKYKVMIDKDNYFKKIKRSDTYGLKQIKTLIDFMKKFSNKFDDKNGFGLRKVEELIKIGNH